MGPACLIMLFYTFISTDATGVIQNHQFILKPLVSQPSQNTYLLSSNTGISSRINCSVICREDGCVSFLYTEIDKRCDTFSRLIEVGNGAMVDISTMYYYRVFSTCRARLQGTPSGVYPISLTEDKRTDVFCDMDTAEGPWIVIQRRTDGEVDFYRDWADYKNGFGNLSGEFWIGNDILHLLTNTSRTLRVEIEAPDGQRGIAEYSTFQVANETEKYRLTLYGFSGNIRDSMGYNNGKYFSTKDTDYSWFLPGEKCADKFHGGWWFDSCTETHLNGLITPNGYYTAMFWGFFPNSDQVSPLKTAMMMIR